MFKGYVKQAKYYIISLVISIVLTTILLLDKLITLIKYNEYGATAVILFILIFMLIALAIYIILYLLLFIIYKISKAKQQTIITNQPIKKIEGTLFQEIPNLTGLEQKHKYNETLKLLSDLWSKDEDNLDLILRLSSQCWYYLTNENITITNDECNFIFCKKMLIKITDYVIQKDYIENPTCAWFFGYAMTLFPFCFYEENDDQKYLFIESLGKNLCRKVLTNETSTIVMKYIVSQHMNNEDNSTITNEDLNIAFPGNSLIEEYFKEICLNKN